MAVRRGEYAGSVHDEDENAAVLAVLQGPPTAIRIGRNVREFERQVAALCGKRHGIMCNSGSSALYLAVELLGLSPGDEVITSAVVFSTDIAPLVRSGLVPVIVDVEPDTYNIDVDRIEEMIGPRTKALLIPNLIGNAPDWDRIRAIADRHGLIVVEDSCDALGQTLRGTPTATRADISLTSFALSHIITAMGQGGMVFVDDDEIADRCLMLRRWGRRSEVQLFGSRKGDKRFFSDVDGLEYDNLWIFDEIGWNSSRPKWAPRSRWCNCASWHCSSNAASATSTSWRSASDVIPTSSDYLASSRVWSPRGTRSPSSAGLQGHRAPRARRRPAQRGSRDGAGPHPALPPRHDRVRRRVRLRCRGRFRHAVAARRVGFATMTAVRASRIAVSATERASAAMPASRRRS
jgi:hypothetical protein